MYNTAFILYCADLFLTLYITGVKYFYIILKYSHLMKKVSGTAPPIPRSNHIYSIVQNMVDLNIRGVVLYRAIASGPSQGNGKVTLEPRKNQCQRYFTNNS